MKKININFGVKFNIIIFIFIFLLEILFFNPTWLESKFLFPKEISILSVLQPVLSLNYILSSLLGFFILNETITSNKLLGILIITIGVILISGGDS